MSENIARLNVNTGERPEAHTIAEHEDRTVSVCELTASGFTPTTTTNLRALYSRIEELENEIARLKTVNVNLEGRVNGYKTLPEMLKKMYETKTYWEQRALRAENHLVSSATNAWMSDSVSHNLKNTQFVEIDSDQREARGQSGVQLVSAMQLGEGVDNERLQHNELRREYDKMRQLLERTEIERDVAIKQKKEMENEVHCLRGDLQTSREESRQKEAQLRQFRNSFNNTSFESLTSAGPKSTDCLAQQPAVQQPPWTCQVCTMKNDSSRLSCEMCGFLKENKVKARLEEDAPLR